MFCLCPISAGGNIQINEGLGKNHGQTIVSDQPMDYRDSVQSW
jgi:hypothetical protein